MQHKEEALRWRRNAEEGETELEKFKETVRHLELEVLTLQQTYKVLTSLRNASNYDFNKNMVVQCYLYNLLIIDCQ
jgi:hypothetical protein